MHASPTAHARRLLPGDAPLARALFALFADVFDEPSTPLDAAYVEGLLARPDFWALAAFDGDHLVGGATAYALPMTKRACTDLFLYDIAVRPESQRRGIGRLLVATLRAGAAAAGLGEVFVLADDDDAHALDFYRAIGGTPLTTTMFTFGGE